MEKLNYKGKDYDSVEVKLSTGEVFVYADSELSNDMELNCDFGCSLDNNIDFYMESYELGELDNLVKSGATDTEIFEFCYEYGIYIGSHTVEQIWENNGDGKAMSLVPYNKAKNL